MKLQSGVDLEKCLFSKSFIRVGGLSTLFDQTQLVDVLLVVAPLIADPVELRNPWLSVLLSHAS